MTSPSTPLKGLRVLNTRAGDAGWLLHQHIHNLGGQSIDFPILSILPTPTTWLTRLPPLPEVKQAIFVSQNAVEHFFNVLKQQDIKWPSSIQAISIGEATATALRKWHIPSEKPLMADSEHLLALNSLQKINKQTLLLVKGIGGRPEITDTLSQRGANLIVFEVYQRGLPQIDPQKSKALWHENQVDIILITSVQALNNLITLLSDAGRHWLYHKPCLVISPRIAEAATQLGLKQLIVCPYNEILIALKHYAENGRIPS